MTTVVTRMTQNECVKHAPKMSRQKIWKKWYISHTTAPSLQLPVLSFYFYRGLNQIAFPDLTPAQLKNLFLWENEISEEKADEIFAKLVASTSADSIEELDLYRNSLTRIPSQVGSAFTKLTKVDIEDWNSISHISSSSLTFVSPYLKDLYLY